MPTCRPPVSNAAVPTLAIFLRPRRCKKRRPPSVKAAIKALIDAEDPKAVLSDDALVDFSMRLPAEYKLKGMQLRWFFKEALRGFLPDEILTKKKQGFGLPFGVWANRHDGLRQLASDSLHSLAGRGIVQQDFIDKLLKDHLPAHPGYYGEMVWILMMLEQWIRQSDPPDQTR